MKKTISKAIVFSLSILIGISVITLSGVNAYATEDSSIVVPKASDIPAEVMHEYVKLTISNITTEDMTPEQKLRACFDYELEHMKYKRNDAKGIEDDIENYALEAFFTGRGNCYRFASMFAYMAKELGFDAYVEAGDCTSSKGGLTPHSWCVIDYPDGSSLVYDLSFADANRKQNFYGIEHNKHTRKLYPYEKWSVKY